MANVTPRTDQAESAAPATRRNDSAARMANVVLGAWLFVSAFLWPHTTASRTNTCVVGALIVVMALLGKYTPPLRWVNAAAATWLFGSTIWIEHASAATPWNNAVVAILVLILSIVSTSRRLPINTRQI